MEEERLDCFVWIPKISFVIFFCALWFNIQDDVFHPDFVHHLLDLVFLLIGLFFSWAVRISKGVAWAASEAAAPFGFLSRSVDERLLPVVILVLENGVIPNKFSCCC